MITAAALIIVAVFSGLVLPSGITERLSVSKLSVNDPSAGPRRSLTWLAGTTTDGEWSSLQR